MPGLS
jgi:hypothetical protein